ncbi:serine/threonine-protein kinase MARK1-like [Olea europaea var. sylvestris]|uniref:serine/threonine-protein kinase MARK1-like n=1 Tax=Olea europaea var. sylvestris TaxID=158386 RepID=UPI000C1D7E5E|nr:serine/threonine-protein kinase MARK1-like [Olea europaea var. sylvestris]XP_022881318.1 serine/threonine-protein kinase MARK1-like [Olea europaea var. sylvestris]
MDQFRQIGEVLGSLKAVMVLKHDIPINQRQCCLLYDMLVLAFDTISEEIRQNLRFEDRNTKWKALELPMKELYRIFKEADLYIRYCVDVKDWWGKVISLHLNRDCVEFHIHNLLCCFPVVIEAIETAAEVSGVDQEEMQKRRLALIKKYDEEWNEPKIFQWKFGKQYLVPREICSRLDTAWKEDRWLLLEKLKEKKSSSAKHEKKLGEFLIKKLSDAEQSKTKLLPNSVLLAAADYYVKRRLDSTGGAGHFKEIQWLGESFALRTFYGEIEPLNPEISSVLSLSHPNVLQNHCAFFDEERKEGLLVMELMNKDLNAYIKENCGQRKRLPFSTPVAVDIMLQIARGMEYLHSRKIYHGDLNPSNILLKARNGSMENFFQAKISGFGLTSIKSYSARSPKPTGIDPDIWLAPEVLAEQEQPGGKCTMKYSEKADVYSFGMLCFELLTGKVPFGDGRLQGEKMARNIRAGERPLFPYPSPKYLSNLTRKCWQMNPNLRPTFSSLCRILRYIKKTLVINPDHGQPDSAPPLVDYCDMEAGYLKKLTDEKGEDLAPVSQIPFQMFGYKLIEKEKISGKNWDLTSDGSVVHRAASMFDEEHFGVMDDFFLAQSDQRSVHSEIIERKYSTLAVDQRSVISEIPHRQFFSFDQRSFGSESPGRKYLGPAADQRSVGAETLERKSSFILRADQSSSHVQSPENKILPKMASMKQKVEVAELKAENCSTPEPIHSLIKEGEQKLVSTEIVEKKLLSPRPTVEQKSVYSDGSGGKISSRSTVKLVEIPEKKTLEPESIQKTVSGSSKISEKKSGSETKHIGKSSNTTSSEKKDLVVKKTKDMKTKSSPGTLNGNSPRSSPSRIMKTNPSRSPASSPGRVSRTRSSPKWLPAYYSRDYSSPRSSPLNQSARISRENRVPSGMSPRRSRTNNVSNSVAA